MAKFVAKFVACFGVKIRIKIRGKIRGNIRGKIRGNTRGNIRGYMPSKFRHKFGSTLGFKFVEDAVELFNWIDISLSSHVESYGAIRGSAKPGEALRSLLKSFQVLSKACKPGVTKL